MSNRPDATWTPLEDAAVRLGISRDAARKRLERGTLAGEKRGGRWHVCLDSQDATSDAVSSPTGRHLSGQPDATQDAIWTPPDAMLDMGRELIDQLKSENQYLREQLADRSRELATERERSDVLQQLALSRIPAVGAGEAFSGAQDGPGASIETPMADDPFTTNGAPQRPLRDHDVAILATQLIEELGMDPEAARAAAADELGIS